MPDLGNITEIRLPRALPDVFGLGAYLKASVCVLSQDSARVTETAGDLGTLDAIAQYDRLLHWALGEIAEPACVAHDLHPDFYSTQKAPSLGGMTLPVQHHHAHTLATAWENGVTDPVLGVSLDGYGMGPDGASWGGELLHVDGLAYRRLGHLAELQQPGGDVAAREPWRMAAAALHALGRGDEVPVRFADQPHAAMLPQMLDRGINSPKTSSCGRLFDAACGLSGLRACAEFEGQAPMEFEALVTRPEPMTGGWVLRDGQLSLLPLLDSLTDLEPAHAANLFHGTLVSAMVEWIMDAHSKTGTRLVALGGGCFLNKVLTDGLTDALEARDMTVLRPQDLSPGDAGLSFGQAIAAGLFAERNGELPCV